MSARNVKGALELLSGMDQGSYIGSLSYLEGRIRELICAKCLDERGSGASLAAELGKQDWQVKNLRGWARRFTIEELVSALKSCAKADSGLKSGADPRDAMVRLVLGIAQG